MSCYDALVDDTNFHDKYKEAVKAEEAAVAQDELNQDRNAAEAHAAKINANVRHYFTKCEDGSGGPNIKYLTRKKNDKTGHNFRIGI